MPPPKKAAKKAAKKSAKKSARHADPNHKARKDVRRAFEHLGRIESLEPALEAGAKEHVTSLVSLAQQELKKADALNAADLLRAAEHLGFAALAAEHAKQSVLSSPVMGGIEEEYEHLAHKAEERWEEDGNRHPLVKSLYKDSLQRSRKAFSESNYRQALELVRAAVALAHIFKSGPDELASGRAPLSITSTLT